MNNGFGTLQSPLAGFNLLTGNFVGIAVGLEFLKTRRNYLGQVALLVALGHADGFIQLALAQCAGHRRSELAGLFTSGVEGNPAVNHHADRPGRHDEENDDDDPGQPAHLLPQRNGVPAYAARIILKEPDGN